MANSLKAASALGAATGALALLLFACGRLQPEVVARGLRASPANVSQARPAERGPRALGSACLCLFGVDRVLTGLQGDTCSGANKVVDGVHDPSHGGGNLTLSALGRAGVGGTFCGACHLGLVTSLGGGGPDMRARLAVGVLDGRAGSVWSSVVGESPLVVGCDDYRKANCAEGVMNWYKGNGTLISFQDVYFFDDSAMAVGAFRFTGMNAVQVSCGSRSGDIGHCGATPAEIVAASGLHFC